MKEIPIPQDAQLRVRKKRSLMRAARACEVATLVLSVLSVLCLVGLLVVVIMLELRENSAETERLLYLLTGVFASCAALLAGGAFLCGKLSKESRATALDYRERLDGAESFFVGEGTLLTFGQTGIRLHDEAGEKKAIDVPYSDLTFYSVCTRSRPRESGAWSVVVAMPARYVMREGKERPPRALIQTDGKERLYRAIEAHGETLRGEQPPRGKRTEKHKFTRRTVFLLPDRQRRRRALLWAGIAGMVVVAGVLIAVLLRAWLTIGAIVAVFGAFFAVRSLISFARAKASIAFYDEGLYWREGGRAIDERIFLKWEEIERVSLETVQGKHYLKLTCAYGNYHLPDIAGVYEALQQTRPALCGEEKARAD